MALAAETSGKQPKSLGDAASGYRGVVRRIVPTTASTMPAQELERRLVEVGFVEGTPVTVLHEGPIGRDPIAVRVGNTTFALRRAEASAILVDALNEP